MPTPILMTEVNKETDEVMRIMACLASEYSDKLNFGFMDIYGSERSLACYDYDEEYAIRDDQLHHAVLIAFKEKRAYPASFRMTDTEKIANFTLNFE